MYLCEICSAQVSSGISRSKVVVERIKSQRVFHRKDGSTAGKTPVTFPPYARIESGTEVEREIPCCNCCFAVVEDKPVQAVSQVSRRRRLLRYGWQEVDGKTVECMYTL